MFESGAMDWCVQTLRRSYRSITCRQLSLCLNKRCFLVKDPSRRTWTLVQGVSTAGSRGRYGTGINERGFANAVDPTKNSIK